jgi:hypothetical protein
VATRRRAPVSDTTTSPVGRRSAGFGSKDVGPGTTLLLTTLLTSMLTFSLPRTNVLLGCVHLQLFGAYFMLLFDR